MTGSLEYRGDGPMPSFSHEVSDPAGTIRIEGVLMTDEDAEAWMLEHGWHRVERRPSRVVRNAPVSVSWVPTGMRAQVIADVAVVRAARPRRCSSCGHRRVLFALTITEAVIGNPEAPWRCAPCWGLRP